jgi:hypothetical protein
MKRLFPVCLVAGIGAAYSYADSAESAIVAMMRLTDEPNYSWVATVADDARTYDVFGKTIRGGFTEMKMPVINSVRRKLGRSVTDTQIALIFRGNVDCVIETDDGWRKPAELPMLAWNRSEAPLLRGTPARASVFGVPRGSIQGSISHLPKMNNREVEIGRAYSNLQLGISHPHEELGVIVGSHQEFHVENDVVTGSLNDLGAQLLLVRDGQKYIEPILATGTFKVWLRDGMVTKYQVTLEGILKIHLQSGKRKVQVHQVTDTILKDVGTTTFEVPAQAREKLGT